LAFEAGFVAVEKIEGAGLIAEGAEGEGGASGRVIGGGVELFHFVLEVGALDGPEAEETPTANGKVFDQGALDFVAGSEIALEGFEEAGDDFEVFVFEEDDLGQETVT
jgi:hypothetical protein